MAAMPEPVKLHLGPVKERFKALDLDSLEFQQSTAPSYYRLSGGPYYITREAGKVKRVGRRYLVGRIRRGTICRLLCVVGSKGTDSLTVAVR